MMNHHCWKNRIEVALKIGNLEVKAVEVEVKVAFKIEHLEVEAVMIRIQCINKCLKM